MVVLVVLSLSFSVVAVLSALCVCLFWRARARSYVVKVAHRAAVAEKALRDQGMLANEVAHELKNPITAIVCAAQTLEMLLDPSLDSGQRSALRHIKEHGEYVLSLMGDFIDVTRGATGHLHSIKEVLSVAGPVRSIAGMLEPIACKKKVCLEIRGCDEVPSVSVDPKHLKQILFNLAHNAVKFSPLGGKVAITAKQSVDGCGGVLVTISVKDEGPGIPSGRLRTIFSAADNFKVASGDGVGCGLGLPLTKTLVELEGGVLRIVSEEGQGTEASVTFDAVTVQAAASDGASATNSAQFPLAGQKILVVEDDPELREAVAGLIRALGGAVDGVGEAVQALEAVQRSQYSTVVIDEYVGGLTAGEVAEMMKSQPGAREARFVVTGDGESESSDDHGPRIRTTLEKPFDSRTLVASLLGRG